MIVEHSRYVYFVAGVAALGGLLFGYDTAVIAGAIGFLRQYFELGAAQMGWAASSALVGCVIGVACTGILSDWMGRRNVLILSALMFTISAVGSALPRTLTAFVIYRMIGGFGVGAASMLSPLYIAEISPANIRGRLVSINQFAIVSGMLVVYFVNYFIAGLNNELWNVQSGWRWMFASEALPAVLFLIALFFVPESPRWLVKRHRISEATGILTRVGGKEKAEEQVRDIQSNLIRESASVRQLFKPGVRKILFIGVALAILQQITGINVILYYAPEIFKKLGSASDAALVQTIIVGAINLAFTIVAIRTVDKWGRKPLMLVGAIGMAVSLVAFGIAAFVQATGIGLLLFVLAYIASFALSVGPVTWVILSEIFPTHIRGRAISICTIFLWAANYLVSQTFPMLDENTWLVNTFHHAFSFWVYAAFCVVLFFVVKVWVPETKNKSLEDIERELILE